MNFLAFLWLILTIIELTNDLPSFFLKSITVIWVLFILQFVLEIILAPNKWTYLKHHWLTAIALIVPAFRVVRFFRIFRYARLLRGTTLIRIVSSINRGMNALRKSLNKRAIPYVFCLTIIIILGAAAGIISLEKSYSPYFKTYTTALWWSSMMITTMGTDYFPKSPEGRALALLLAIYGFAMFGYITAIVANFFIDKDNFKDEEGSIKRLENEILEIKTILQKMNHPDK
jgi:voltage-gated potassium channel